jgi:hypothetical protein
MEPAATVEQVDEMSVASKIGETELEWMGDEMANAVLDHREPGEKKIAREESRTSTATALPRSQCDVKRPKTAGVGDIGASTLSKKYAVAPARLTTYFPHATPGSAMEAKRSGKQHGAPPVIVGDGHAALDCLPVEKRPERLGGGHIAGGIGRSKGEAGGVVAAAVDVMELD